MEVADVAGEKKRQEHPEDNSRLGEKRDVRHAHTLGCLFLPTVLGTWVLWEKTFGMRGCPGTWVLWEITFGK